ncbi:hypothetical protein ACJ2A9_04800 [Anaerobacillus sp. MEB173]|uniref:hypothetical protein n=1 Tax=Anaerobacillus sp. MEB173 TaxID=3383345 RepID=UPI003F91BF26
MITNLEKDIRVQMINNRLQNLSRQYFEVKLDLVQAEANGSTGEIEHHTQRLTQLEKSYDAIKLLLDEAE